MFPAIHLSQFPFFGQGVLVPRFPRLHLAEMKQFSNEQLFFSRRERCITTSRLNAIQVFVFLSIFLSPELSGDTDIITKPKRTVLVQIQGNYSAYYLTLAETGWSAHKLSADKSRKTEAPSFSREDINQRRQKEKLFDAWRDREDEREKCNGRYAGTKIILPQEVENLKLKHVRYEERLLYLIGIRRTMKDEF